MKFQKTILATAVAIASTQLYATDINTTLTSGQLLNTDGDNLTITSSGAVDTTAGSGEDAVSTEGGNNITLTFITNDGSVLSSGDGILIDDGDVVSGAITNNGTINIQGSGSEAWASAISIASTVGGGIVNSSAGSINVDPTNCEDTVCIASSGVGVFGGATVSGGITNAGSITTTTANVTGNTNAHQDAGIKVLAVINSADNSLVGSPTVNGNISNSGTITSRRSGIEISGATINGDIVNANGATISADSAIRINANAGQLNVGTDDTLGVLGDGEDLQGNDVYEVGPVATTINGSIINAGTLNGTGTDGITFNGNVTVTGSIQNSGIISATATDGVGAIYFEGGGTAINGGIINTGTLSVAAGASTPDSDGVVYLNNQGHAAIHLGQGDSVSKITNSGSIINAGFQSGGFAIAAQEGGSIGEIENQLGGVIAGAVDFGSAGGTYFFTGGLQTGQIMNASTIRLGTFGQAGSNVSGFVGDFNYSGTLVVDAIGVDQGNGITSIDHGLLFVDGATNVSGATVNVNVSNEEFIKPGDSLDVVHSTGALTTSSTTITDNSALLAFDLSQEVLQQDVDGESQAFNVLKATAKSAQLEDIGEEAGIDTTSTGFENTANVFVAVQSIDQSTVESGSDLDQLLTALNTEGLTPEETVAAAASLDAETVEGSSVGSQAADAAAAGTVNGRMTALREGAQTGMVAGDLLSVHGFWVQGYYNDTEQDQRDGVSGFDADTSGIAMGVDAAVNDQVNAGMAISWANTGVDSDGAEQNTMDIDSYRFTLYGAYNAENYYVDGQIAYAANEYDNKRNISAGTYGSVAKSSHDGDQYSLRVRGGYPMALESGFYVTPRAGLEYTYLSEDDYKEKGAGNAGLEVRTDDVEVLLAKLGAKVAYPIVTESETTWIPEVSMDVTHDFIGDEVELDSNFLGAAAAAFVTQGANVEQTGVVAGIRIRAFSQSNFSFSAGYDYLYKKDYAGQSLNATVRYDF